jgi:hypothetical protein
MFMRVDRLGHFPLLEIPYSDRLVIRRREEKLATRVECHGPDPVVVTHLNRNKPIVGRGWRVKRDPHVYSRIPSGIDQ